MDEAVDHGCGDIVVGEGLSPAESVKFERTHQDEADSSERRNGTDCTLVV